MKPKTTPAPTGTNALRARGLQPFIVGLPPEVHRRLKITAAERAIPANELAAEAIKAYLDKDLGTKRKSG